MGSFGSSLWRSAVLGVATGGRSMCGLAAVALNVPTGERNRPASWLSSSGATAVVVLASVGEFGVDKLPGIPSRLSPPGLVSRALLGGLAGAALAAHLQQSEQPRRWVPPAVVAATAALAGTVAGARWRALVHRGPVPDWMGAVAEDVVVIGLASAACTRDLGRWSAAVRAAG